MNSIMYCIACTVHRPHARYRKNVQRPMHSDSYKYTWWNATSSRTDDFLYILRLCNILVCKSTHKTLKSLPPRNKHYQSAYWNLINSHSQNNDNYIYIYIEEEMQYNELYFKCFHENMCENIYSRNEFILLFVSRNSIFIYYFWQSIAHVA